MPEVLTRVDPNDQEWLYDRQQVTVTVQEVADRLHGEIYGPNSRHAAIHSCPCNLFARWYLGLSEKPKMYWPDGKGGNAHEPHPDPRVQFYHLKDEVIETAKADRGANKSGDGRNTDVDAMIKTRNAHNAAIDALIEFESLHGIETKD